MYDDDFRAQTKEPVNQEVCPKRQILDYGNLKLDGVNQSMNSLCACGKKLRALTIVKNRFFNLIARFGLKASLRSWEKTAFAEFFEINSF